MSTSKTVNNNPVVLQVEGLKTYFETRWGTVKAVDGVSFDLKADPGMGVDGVRRPRPLGGGVVDIHYAGARHNVHGVVDEPVWRLASGPFGSPATTAGMIVSNQGSERLTSSHV